MSQMMSVRPMDFDIPLFDIMAKTKLSEPVQTSVPSNLPEQTCRKNIKARFVASLQLEPRAVSSRVQLPRATEVVPSGH